MFNEFAKQMLQGCAMRVPKCLRLLTFAFGGPDKPTFFIIISFMLGTLGPGSYSLEPLGYL